MYLPKVPKPRPILFDLGDTLINFSATNPLPYMHEGTRLAYEYMREHGVLLPTFKSYLRGCQMRTYLAVAVSVFRGREVDLLRTLRDYHRVMRLPYAEAFLLQLAARFYEPMKRFGTLEEDVYDMLDRLVADKHPIAIVSNTMVPSAVLDQHLEEVGLLKYFPVRIYSCDVSFKKPNAQIFLYALRAINAKPQGTLFVGDKVKLDVRGAARLGMTTVLKVRSGPVPRYRFRPDHVIRHLTELPALLERIGRDGYDSTLTLPEAELIKQRRRTTTMTRRAEPAQKT